MRLIVNFGSVTNYMTEFIYWLIYPLPGKEVYLTLKLRATITLYFRTVKSIESTLVLNTDAELLYNDVLHFVEILRATILRRRIEWIV